MGQRAATPLVSVLLSVRDGERFVADAVASILGQSFRDFEFLITDDGSTDGTGAILERLAAADARIELLRAPAAGLTPQLRRGVERARGRYVARMDADDVSLPQRLALQVEYLERHPECSALGAQVLLVDPDGDPIRVSRFPREHEAIDAWLMRGRGEVLPHPAVTLRRDAVLAAGSYSADFAAGQDLDLYLRLAERGRLANLPDTLLAYRQHLGKVSTRRGGEQRRCVNEILRRARERRGAPEAPPVPALPDAVEPVEYWRSWAEAAIGGRNLATARKHARAVLRERPAAWRSWVLWLRAMAGIPASSLRAALRPWETARGAAAAALPGPRA